MSFVQLKDVSKSYSLGDHVVTPLKGVTLDVEKGQFLVLLGPSGSGKSTLLNLVASIDRPDSGIVSVGGENLGTMSRSKAAEWRARTIGYVFQDYSLVPVLSAYENVEIPLWLFRMSKAERHQRVSLALEAVGLSDRHKHLPKQLSGGQQQRVAIARAIVADPDLIVADEPTGNLDAESAEDILHLIRRLNQERGKTVMMVTHDVRAIDLGTQALRLDKGQLHEIEGAVS